MKKEMSVAVAGLRNIGKNHIKANAHLENVSFVAGIDTDADRLHAAKDEFGFSETYQDFDVFLRESTADLVILALPNHLHASFAIKTMQAGKHVLVEKPVARNSAEAREMMQVSQRTEKLLSVGMNQRFCERAYALRQAVRQGMMGQIYHSRAIWTRRALVDGVWQRGSWFLTKEQSGGGPLMDIGVHKLDLALFILGFPEIASVSATCSSGIGQSIAKAKGISYELEDFCYGMIRFRNGSSLHLEASYFHSCWEESQNTISIHGSTGGYDHDHFFRLENGQAVEMTLPEVVDVPKTPLDHIIRVLRGEDELHTMAAHGESLVRVIEALYESAESQSTINL